MVGTVARSVGLALQQHERGTIFDNAVGEVNSPKSPETEFVVFSFLLFASWPSSSELVFHGSTGCSKWRSRTGGEK